MDNRRTASVAGFAEDLAFFGSALGFGATYGIPNRSARCRFLASSGSSTAASAGLGVSDGVTAVYNALAFSLLAYISKSTYSGNRRGFNSDWLCCSSRWVQWVGIVPVDALKFKSHLCSRHGTVHLTLLAGLTARRELGMKERGGPYQVIRLHCGIGWV